MRRNSGADGADPKPSRDEHPRQHGGQISDDTRLAHIVGDARFSHGLYCVRCGGHRVIRWGVYRGRARYLCRGCGRTFNALTETPFAYSKRLDRWLTYLHLMRTQTTLRRAALRLDLHLSTSFRWRHRVLESTLLSRVRLRGVVELGEALFPYSEKGSRRLQREPYTRGGYADKMEWISRRRVRVLLLRARGGDAAATVMVTNVPVTPLITEALTELIDGPALVVAAASRMSAYGAAVVRSRNRLHTVRRAAPPDRSVGLIHIRNVIAFEHRLRRWLRPFRGVATKYLMQYLAWHRFADRDELPGWEHCFVSLIAAPVPLPANDSSEHSGSSRGGSPPGQRGRDGQAGAS